jgi:two-component system sensor histidine kinase MprB
VTLRAKFAIVVGLLTILAGTGIALWGYSTASTALSQAVDYSLGQAAGQVNQDIHEANGIPSTTTPIGQDDTSIGGIIVRPRSFERILVQILDSNGTVVGSPSSGMLPVSETDVTQARSQSSGEVTWRYDDISAEPYRIATMSIGHGLGAVQVARATSEDQAVLNSLAEKLTFAVILLAFLTSMGSWVLASTLSRRLREVTQAADAIADTGMLTKPVNVTGKDEAGRLADAFNRMMVSLETSKQSQQRLIQDAGHELRTPLTSLRANIGMLKHLEALDEEDRGHLLESLNVESSELTLMVNQLVALAADDLASEASGIVDLKDVCESCVEATSRRTGRDIKATIEGDNHLVEGRRGQIARAVTSLLENAAKFAPTGEIELTLENTDITVKDQGDGILEEDLPRIFDRFYRADATRSMKGSGLGLSIVADTATSHHGQVHARNGEGGGAEIGFAIPEVDLDEYCD